MEKIHHEIILIFPIQIQDYRGFFYSIIEFFLYLILCLNFLILKLLVSDNINILFLHIIPLY